MKYLLIFLLYVNAYVQADISVEEQSLSKSFLIAKSTKNYNEAVAFAKKLANKSAISLKLKTLHPSQSTGLTYAASACKKMGYSYPCYVARGRYDDGIYISIEYSDVYSGFTTGYYMVIVASGEKIDKSVLQSVRKYVPDAYVKKTAVYMGCIH